MERRSRKKIDRHERKSSGRRRLSEDRKNRYHGYNSKSNFNGSNKKLDDSFTRKRRRLSSSSSRPRSSKSTSSSRNHVHHRSGSRKRRRADRPSLEIVNDEKNHLVYRTGDIILHRYKLIDTLGEGAFGRVIRCADRTRRQEVALKVVRSESKYREAAELEIEVLKTITKQKDRCGSVLCIQMLDSFRYGGHMCISFPLLGKSVFDFLKDNEFQPYTYRQIMHVTYQLLSAIEFLHDLQLTHTDLKPENLLFVNSDYETCTDPVSKCSYRTILNSDIRIIDFGSTVFEHEYHSRVVGTRHYRPPECILKRSWSYPVDIWSAGCIVVELFTGKALFMTHDNLEHLFMIETILGSIPQHMISSAVSKYFEPGSNRVHIDNNRVDQEYVSSVCIPLKKIFRHCDPEERNLYEIAEGLLAIVPSERWTARSALERDVFSTFCCSFRNLDHRTLYK